MGWGAWDDDLRDFLLLSGRRGSLKVPNRHFFLFVSLQKKKHLKYRDAGMINMSTHRSFSFTHCLVLHS